MSRKSLVPIELPADPTVALEAATKQYVDTRVAGAVRTIRSDVSGISTTSGAAGPIGWATIHEDEGGIIYSSGNGDFSIPVAGLYDIMVQVAFNANATNRRDLTIYKSGSVERLAWDMLAGSAQIETLRAVALGVRMTTSDFFRVHVLQNSGGALAVNTTARVNTVHMARRGN